LRAIFELVAAANRHVDSNAPWQLGKLSTTGDCEQRSRSAVALRHCLSNLVQTLLVCSELLTPFLPTSAATIRERLLPTPCLGPPLFAKLS
jgi:methionyl-tRNA synthetase